jgi:hypothetical protein
MFHFSCYVMIHLNALKRKERYAESKGFEKEI